MNPLYKSREVAFVLSHSEARARSPGTASPREGTTQAGAEFMSVGPTEPGQVMAHEPPWSRRDDQDTAVVL